MLSIHAEGTKHARTRPACKQWWRGDACVEYSAALVARETRSEQATALSTPSACGGPVIGRRSCARTPAAGVATVLAIVLVGAVQ
eukprot:scaffold439_cov415-Prasinococcus_capsulatus_cf.AAC.8